MGKGGKPETENNNKTINSLEEDPSLKDKEFMFFRKHKINPKIKIE